MAGAAVHLPHRLLQGRSKPVPEAFCQWPDCQCTGVFESSATHNSKGSLVIARAESFGNPFRDRSNSMSCCSHSVPGSSVYKFSSFNAGGRFAPSAQRSTDGCCGAHNFDRIPLTSTYYQREDLDCLHPEVKLGVGHSFLEHRYSLSRIYSSLSDDQATDTSDEKAEKLESDDETLPTMEEIQEVAREQGLKIEVRTLGPWFQINLMSADEKLTMGSAEGFETWWIDGKILHLEAIRLTRDAPKGVSVLGPGFLVGAACVRYGLGKNCPKAELLAINDDDETHSKLVKYYSRMGFKAMYELTGEGWTELPDRVVWGGVGTRMDANCEELLRKWAKLLRPKSKQRASNPSKVFSSTTVLEKAQQQK